MQPKLIWSPYQQAIFKDVKEGKDGENTVVIARAGSSKTTSLIEAIKYIPKHKKTILLAFNKSIQQELDQRVNKSYIDIRTIHSYGYSTVKKHFGNVKFDPDKTNNIAANILYAKGYKKFEKQKFNIISSLCKAVNLCKGTLIDTPNKIDVLIDQFDIDTFDLDRQEFINTVCQVLRKCKEETSAIDFSEMVWYPFIFGMRFEQYDRVFIDEAGDLNAAQLFVSLNACKPNGRILAVGDNFQVLYSFTGVEENVLDILVKRLKAKVLPLPISYRCPKAIIKLAQELVPDIQAAPDAKEGSVKTVSENTFLSLVKPGDFILSRVNAPLIYYCMELIRNKVRANIAGRDIGKGLAWLVRKSESKTINEFLIWLEKWKREEVNRLEKNGRDPILILDKAGCLENLCKGSRDTKDILDKINELFSDAEDKDIVSLSSIHRSKGKEANRIFLLFNTLRRDGSQSELNVEYVSITRSKDCLFLVK